MASIQKLVIQGVRSFSPNSEEVIEFYSPLTMIVGANGCGKTSIIESLKYACTGGLPPTCKNGQSFINDPTMTDSTEVKACVKLLFTNKAGKTTCCTRSMQLSKKKTKLEFKALDGAIRTRNDNGENVSTSHKCSELDRHVPELLGVSPAIMENVIFCHQEDSSWPMGEGIVLKKKFDDVFESTRYTKALEAIQKAKKDYMGKLKDRKGELAELAAHQSAANDSRNELETCLDNQERCKRDVEDVEERLRDFQQRYTRVQEVIKQASRKGAELTALEWKVNEAIRREQEKRADLVEAELDASDDDLRNQLDNFEREMRDKNRKHKELLQAVDTLNAEVASLREETNGLNTQLGEANALKKQMDNSCRAIHTQANEAARKYHVPELITKVWTDLKVPAVRTVLADIFTKITTMRTENNAIILDLRSKVEENEKECNKFRSDVQRVEIEQSVKNAEETKVSDDIRAKAAELKGLASAQGDCKKLEEDYQEAKKNEEDCAATFQQKMNTLKENVKKYTDEIKELSDQISDDGALLSELKINQAANDEIRSIERQNQQERSTQQKDTADALMQHKAALTAGPGNADSANYEPGPDNEDPATSIEHVMNVLEPLSSRMVTQKDTLHRQLKTKREELAKLSAELGGINALLPQQESSLSALKTRMKAHAEMDRELQEVVSKLREYRTEGSEQNFFVEEISEIPDGPLDSILAVAEEMDKDMTESIFEANNCQQMARKLKKQQGKSNACPCCKQQVSTEQQKQAFEDGINEFFKLRELGKNNEKSSSLHESIKAALSNLKKILGKRGSDVDKVREEHDACENQVAELKAKKEGLEKEIKDLQKDVNDRETAVLAAEKAATAIEEQKTRWTLIKNKVDYLESKRKKQSQSAASASHSDGRSIREIEEKQTERQELKDELIAKKDKAAKDEGELQKKMSILKSLTMEKLIELQEAQTKGGRFKEVEEATKELKKRSVEIETEKATLQERLDKAKKDFTDAERRLQSAKRELQSREEVVNVQQTSIESDREALQRETDSLDKLVKAAEQKDINSVQNALKEKQDVIERKMEAIRSKTPQMSALNAQLSQEERTKKNIIDNLALREMVRDLARLRDEQRILSEEVQRGSGGTSLRDAERESQRCQQEDEKLKTARATSNGKMEVLRQQETELQSKLNSANYKGVDERHRIKNIEYETTKMAVDDLGLYYDALDTALQNFHTLKIRDINKIIRELWQLIYKGQDIEMIELESGQETAVAAGGVGGGTGRSSRSYNYRVVMRKGDVPLDMRGRCSAGQRVLAAIVIRLALAETFGLNCGILALDEPTTNLDDANKSGLASALAKIIVDRSRQHNFQLICITHDEEFVKLIAQELAASNADYAMPEYYFKVSRQERNEGGGGAGGGGGGGKRGGGRNTGGGGAGKFFSTITRFAWDDLGM